MINWGVWDVKLLLYAPAGRKLPLLQGLGHDDRYPRYDPTRETASRVRPIAKVRG